MFLSSKNNYSHLPWYESLLVIGIIWWVIVAVSVSFSVTMAVTVALTIGHNHRNYGCQHTKYNLHLESNCGIYSNTRPELTDASNCVMSVFYTHPILESNCAQVFETHVVKCQKCPSPIVTLRFNMMISRSEDNGSRHSINKPRVVTCKYLCSSEAFLFHFH